MFHKNRETFEIFLVGECIKSNLDHQFSSEIMSISEEYILKWEILEIILLKNVSQETNKRYTDQRGKLSWNYRFISAFCYVLEIYLDTCRVNHKSWLDTQILSQSVALFLNANSLLILNMSTSKNLRNVANKLLTPLQYHIHCHSCYWNTFYRKNAVIINGY